MKRNLPDMQAALERARKAQDLFWYMLGELERQIGAEIDGTCDLRQVELEDLLKK